MSKKRSTTRLTYKQAEKLYPEEWVVFADARIDLKAGRFIDGIVYWHGKDHRQAYAKAAEFEGPGAKFYTGLIPYRRVTLGDDNAVSKKVA